MIWVVHCTDAPDAGARRLALRAEHSAMLRSQAHVSVITGGPLLSADSGSSAAGSLFLVEAPDRSQVERFVASDPFSVHGVWAEARINAFLPASERGVRATAAVATVGAP